MRKITFLLLFIALASMLRAQKSPKPSMVYTDAASLKLIGQAFPLQNSYYRIDTALYPDFPPAIKRLLTHSSGLAICFKTNSPRIAAKWCVTHSRQGNNMTPIVNKGLDLYIKANGKWVFAGVGRPDSICSESVIVQNMNTDEKECLLYLPLYDAVKSLSVGIDGDYHITPGEDPFTKKRVLLYGSSITQGASASRPGMAYPARLSRATGMQFINLGLSGNGKMEKEVADMVAEAKADVFVLDCFANPGPEQITERTGYLVKTIRQKHPDAPIIMIESVIREAGTFDSTIRKMVTRQNENTRKEYQKLIQGGIKNLYLIPGENLLGKDHEGTTDGSHPNDLGFDRMLKVLEPELVRILQPDAEKAKSQTVPKRLRLGYSIPIDKITPEKMAYAKSNGIDFIETSINRYIDSGLNFLFSNEEIIAKVKAAKKATDDAGIQIWSIHMAAGKARDISMANEAERQKVIELHKKMLGYCAILKPSIILFHPSWFLGLGDRELRKSQMIKSAIELNKPVQDIHATLVIENMLGADLKPGAKRERPLFRNVEESVEIMSKLPASIYSAIDLNHISEPEKLIYAMGPRLKTLHVADGTGLAEDHFFPCSGQGKNNWVAILTALNAVGYSGPFMYESAYKDEADFRPCYEKLYQSFLQSLGTVSK